MSELDELLADLTLEQRAKLRQALQLLEADKANKIPQEQLDLAESAVQCHRSEFVIEDVVRQTFVNGDKLFRATPFAEEVRQQIPEVDFLELAEPRSAVTTLPSVVKWTESNFPGYVKILGSVVDDREKPLKERKVIGLIYEVAADTLQALIEKSGDLRNDHRMYLALTSFQAWHHSLYYGPCLSVFTLANVVVKGNESPGATHPFSAQLRLQFPTALYEEAMGTETLDTNVLQLADVLWFVCHGDAQKLKEMPRQEKPIDGEQMWKFSCQKFLKSLYEQQSKIVTKSEHLVVKMQRELAEVQQHFSEL